MTDHFLETLQKDQSTPIRIWFSAHSHEYDSHWHHPLEIIMPMENYYDVKSCGRCYHVLKGEILIVPARIMHSVYAPQTGNRFIFQFDDSALSHMQGYTEIQSLMGTCLHITQTTHPYIYENIRQLLLQIWDEFFGFSEFRDMTIYADLIKLLQIVGKDLKNNARPASTPYLAKQKEHNQKINAVLTYIDKYYSENITLESAAAYSGFSKYYFSRFFKQYMNCTFYEYLCFRRLKAAEELLCRVDLTITEAALLSGFSSISTFNRVFRQRKGCTPSEYRASYANH